MSLLTALLLVPLLALGSPGAAPGAGAMPKALIGVWTTVAASGSQYCDTSDCRSAYGGSETWTFTADAHWEYSQYLDTTLYDCSQTTFLDVTGTVAATDSSVTLTSDHASNMKSDTCGETTYEELDILPSVYQWQVLPADDGHPQLFLTNDAGTTGPFDPRPVSAEASPSTP